MLTAVAMGSAGYALYGLVVKFSGADTILWFEKTAYHGLVTGTFVNRNSFADVRRPWLAVHDGGAPGGPEARGRRRSRPPGAAAAPCSSRSRTGTGSFSGPGSCWPSPSCSPSPERAPRRACSHCWSSSRPSPCGAGVSARSLILPAGRVDAGRRGARRSERRRAGAAAVDDPRRLGDALGDLRADRQGDPGCAGVRHRTRHLRGGVPGVPNRPDRRDRGHGAQRLSRNRAGARGSRPQCASSVRSEGSRSSARPESSSAAATPRFPPPVSQPASWWEPTRSSISACRSRRSRQRSRWCSVRRSRSRGEAAAPDEPRRVGEAFRRLVQPAAQRKFPPTSRTWPGRWPLRPRQNRVEEWVHAHLGAARLRSGRH